MVSEPDVEPCASNDTRSLRELIVRSRIGWKREQNISCKGVETSP